MHVEANLDAGQIVEIAGEIVSVARDDFAAADVLVDSRRGLVRARGYIVMPFVGIEIAAKGLVVGGRTGGPLLRIDQATCAVPKTPSEQIHFLTSTFPDLIDDSTAHQFAVAFGPDLCNVLDFEPQRLDRIVPSATSAAMQKRWFVMREAHQLEASLASLGAAPTLAKKTIQGLRQLGVTENFADAVVQNPYLLSRVHALDFQKADEIAMRREIPRESQMRLDARIIDDLERLASGAGHTAYPRIELVRRVTTSLEVSRGAVDSSVDRLTRAREDVVDATIDEKPVVALGEYYRAEVSIAEDTLRLRETCEPLYCPDDPAIGEILSRAPVPLSELQKFAVFSALTKPVCVITGGPGMGKTMLSGLIAMGALRKHPRLALVAPTGRAAKRMSIIKPAMTIERTLGMTARGFTYNDRNPLDAQYLLGDEWGMVSAELARDLLRAVRCPVTFIGDVNQLASVKAGNVLADMISSTAIPVIRLKENFRTDSLSILRGAASVLDGELPTFDEQFGFHQRNSDDGSLEVIARGAKNAVEALGSFDDVQVLSAQRDGLLGTNNLNNVLQDVLNPSAAGKREYAVGNAVFREGDRVMQTRNDYDRDYMNGDIGYIEHLEAGRVYVRVDETRKTIEIPRVALNDVALAYAITIHKSQGGEYKHVLMALSLDHRNMLNKNLLYTGITRAKSRVSMVGSMEAMVHAINTNANFTRFSTLGSQLREKHLELAYAGPDAPRMAMGF